MRAPTNIAKLPITTPKKKLTVYHLVSVMLLIGFLAVVRDVLIERMDEIYIAGMAEGYNLAVNDIKGPIKSELAKAEKVSQCMKFWFKEDHDFVGKALQKVKVAPL